MPWRSSFLSLVLALAAVLLSAIAPAASTSAQSNVPGQELRAIANKLQCPVCDGTSVADSRSPIAQDMRRIIAEKVAAGEGEAQILQYFVERYGPGVLRDPARTGLYSAIWWVPIAAIAAGALAIVALNRRSNRMQQGSP